jgi:hypothetical protein
MSNEQQASAIYEAQYIEFKMAGLRRTLWNRIGILGK